MINLDDDKVQENQNYSLISGKITVKKVNQIVVNNIDNK